MRHCGGAASLQFDADVTCRHLGFGLHIERDEVGHRQGWNVSRLRRRCPAIIGTPSVHHVRIQVVQPRDCRGRSIRLPARLKDISFEPRAVLATGCPLDHTIYCVHIIHRGHDACRLSGNQHDFTVRLPARAILVPAHRTAADSVSAFHGCSWIRQTCRCSAALLPTTAPTPSCTRTFMRLCVPSVCRLRATAVKRKSS